MALVKSWLESTVSLPQYYETFIVNGYDTLEKIKLIENKKELQRMGIVLKGHQTKIMADVNRLIRFE